MHTLRPAVFWARFRWSIPTILRSLRRKICRGIFEADLPRQSQQYWWRGLRRQAAQIRNRSPSPAVLRELLRRGIVPASHSLA